MIKIPTPETSFRRAAQFVLFSTSTTVFRILGRVACDQILACDSMPRILILGIGRAKFWETNSKVSVGGDRWAYTGGCLSQDFYPKARKQSVTRRRSLALCMLSRESRGYNTLKYGWNMYICPAFCSTHSRSSVDTDCCQWVRMVYPHFLRNNFSSILRCIHILWMNRRVFFSDPPFPPPSLSVPLARSSTVQTRDVTHMKNTGCAYVCVMSHLRMRHVPRAWMIISQILHMNASCHGVNTSESYHTSCLNVACTTYGRVRDMLQRKGTGISSVLKGRRETNRRKGKTGVTADRDKIEFWLFNSSSIFNITLREELFSLPKKNQTCCLVLVSWC